MNNHKRLSDILDASDAAKHGRVNTKPVDKIERFKWTMADHQGSFRMIPKEQLHVDYAYQRSHVTSRVHTIARDWSWVGCGCLIVSERDDGTIWVVDGQHRALAALRRSDISTLPCLVWKIPSVDKEAGSFVRANTLSKALGTVEQFKAAIIAQNPDALYIEKILADVGYTVGENRNINTVKCIRAIKLIYDEDIIMFPEIMRQVADVSRPQPIPVNLVLGAGWLARATKGESLDPSWTAKMKDLGLDRLLAAIQRKIHYEQKGGPRIYGCGLGDALNSGRRTKFLKFEGARSTV